MQLHYDVHRGAGTGLLLVHGFLSSSAQWIANIEGMKAFATPVTVDLWGHGRSAAPSELHLYTPEAYIEAFERLRTELGFEQWAICGASFGASLTLRYALTHPHRITRQIFTNSMSGLSERKGSREQRERQADAIMKGGRKALEALPFHPRFAKRLAPLVMDGLLRDAAMLSPLGVANAMRATVPDLSVADSFSRTSVPTLLIDGTWEKEFRPIKAWAIANLPDLKVIDLDGGHSINAEAPDAFNDAVRDFLSSLAALRG